MDRDDSIMPGDPEYRSTKGRRPAVLQVLPSLVSGGAERGTVELAAALAAAGWTAYVASSGGPMERDLTRARAIHLTLPLASKNPLIMWRNRTALAHAIRRLGIDIVHARSRAPAWSAWSAAAATGRHFVTTFHNAYGARSAPKHLYNSVMARGERVIAISDFVADHVDAVYGVGPDRLRTIPRGVDLNTFDAARVGGERIPGLACEWRLPEGAPVVMLPGRLTRWKGGLDLVAAIAALGRRDVCCVFVGAEQRPGFRRELETAIARSGLADIFRIVEHCADMPAAYLLADVVVSASTNPEGFGRIIAEAQAMGRPVVATDHGGARETIVPGVTGWLVPPRNPKALAAAIDAALALEPRARVLLRLRAREHIAAHFTTAAMCARTIAVYEELLHPAPDTPTADDAFAAVSAESRF
jgi:glycosyltransferase involved in cell wall biosynthesis